MRKTQTTDTTPTALFWSERGRTACARHAPYRGSDTWRWERWQAVPAEAFALADSVALRCESCDQKARHG